ALLVLDDLHAADPDSLEVARYVSAAAIEGLAIIAALRPGESPLAGELARSLRSDPASTFVELDPLDLRAVGELIADLLGATVPAELIADVAARTDGVPLLVEEVVDAYLRAGSVEVKAGQAHWRRRGAPRPPPGRGGGGGRGGPRARADPRPPRA